jgi:hypothetical protein
MLWKRSLNVYRFGLLYRGGTAPPFRQGVDLNNLLSAGVK